MCATDDMKNEAPRVRVATTRKRLSRCSLKFPFIIIRTGITSDEIWHSTLASTLSLNRVLVLFYTSSSISARTRVVSSNTILFSSGVLKITTNFLLEFAFANKVLDMEIFLLLGHRCSPTSIQWGKQTKPILITKSILEEYIKSFYPFDSLLLSIFNPMSNDLCQQRKGRL